MGGVLGIRGRDYVFKVSLLGESGGEVVIFL